MNLYQGCKGMLNGMRAMKEGGQMFWLAKCPEGCGAPDYTAWLQPLKEGRLEEAWGTGTAAVVSPIGELSYKGEKYEINNFKIGETTQMLYDTLTSIQWGKAEDKFNWITKVC